MLALLCAFERLLNAGRTALLSTVGGRPRSSLGGGGPAAVALGAAVTMVKLGAAVVSLALVRPWGQRLPRRLLELAALAGAAVLGVFGSPPRNATGFRWHVLVWDLWFLLWGVLLAEAALLRGQSGGQSRVPGDTIR